MQIEKLDLEHAHEIHNDEETIETIQHNKEEWEVIKQRIKFDVESTYIDVVKDDDGNYINWDYSKLIHIILSSSNFIFRSILYIKAPKASCNEIYFKSKRMKSRDRKWPWRSSFSIL